MILPTRVIHHADGSLEIVRILTAPALERWSSDKNLSYESSLVWLAPIESLDYVRVGTVNNAPRRNGRIRLADGLIVVGFANLTSDAPLHPRTGGFVRRVFYWRAEDLKRNLNDIPDGAIDPATLLPGQVGADCEVSELLQSGYPRSLRREKCAETPNLRLRKLVVANKTLACAG